jgi:PhzF family phenazine biosynthesis protein
MKIPLYQVDAFTSRAFAGNPAAVCPLTEWLADETMQAIAMENNLSETAFFVPRDGEVGAYDIRWFTPTLEIDLAGHPTLATAYVIFERLQPGSTEARFHSRHGDVLEVVYEDGLIAMDFPSRPPAPNPEIGDVGAALGAWPAQVLAARDALAVFATEAEVRALAPDMAKVAALDVLGVIATAPGDHCDFVSRFFAPKAGVPEDPVTGSAHCTLVPYWAGRFGNSVLFARQISPRGGELWCEHRGERVRIAGQAALYMEGAIILP